MTTDKAVTTAQLGAVLVLTDLVSGALDQRTKAWADSDPVEVSDAFDIAARYRGLAGAPKGGFHWKGSST